MPKSVPFRDRSFVGTAAVLVAVAVALLLVSAFVSSDPATVANLEEKPPTPVTTEIAVLSPGYEVERSFIGRVEARRESDIGFELPGMVSEILFDDGAIVQAGDVIARLDTKLLEARRAELVSAMNRAQVQLDLAGSTRARVREASDLDAVSAQVLDEAEQGFASNEAALTAARSAIATLDVQIQKSELKAPFDALVAMRYLDEGQVINAGTPILRLLENARPEVRIGISSDAVEQLQVGETYPLAIGDRQVDGRLRSVLPERQLSTRGIGAVFELDAGFNGIRRGDLVELFLSDEVTTPSYRLPLASLTESARGIWAIYVVEEDQSGFFLDRRQVELLHNQGDEVMVRGTLAAGELVVSGGTHRLVPGQRVRAVNQSSSTARTNLSSLNSGGEQ